jgi:adenosylcobinamide kinase/adenosylcobinamide-phosphate guanylyltransferase
MSEKYLVLGGARSGKSRFAEQQALQLSESGQGLSLLYVATASAQDSEMQQRIERHQQDRDARWQLLETPLDLAEVIQQYSSEQHCILVDCLTLWLTNALIDNSWPQRKAEFLAALSESRASVYLVSNEVGSGIVPLGELSRQFVDASGWLHQELAAMCHRVTLVVAGLPVILKP